MGWGRGAFFIGIIRKDCEGVGEGTYVGYTGSHSVAMCGFLTPKDA